MFFSGVIFPKLFSCLDTPKTSTITVIRLHFWLLMDTMSQLAFVVPSFSFAVELIPVLTPYTNQIIPSFTLMRCIISRGLWSAASKLRHFAYPERIVREAHRLQFIAWRRHRTIRLGGCTPPSLAMAYHGIWLGAAGFTYDSTPTYADHPASAAAPVTFIHLLIPLPVRQLQDPKAVNRMERVLF